MIPFEKRRVAAANLTFPDGYFDTVVAMFVMPVVPDPLHVMSELNRVCAVAFH